MAFYNRQESTDNKALHELRDALIDLNASTKKANFWMIILTITIVVLTLVLAIEGLINN